MVMSPLKKIIQHAPGYRLECHLEIWPKNIG